MLIITSLKMIAQKSALRKTRCAFPSSFYQFKIQHQVGTPYSVRSKFCHEHVLGFDLLHAMEVSNLCHILPL